MASYDNLPYHLQNKLNAAYAERHPAPEEPKDYVDPELTPATVIRSNGEERIYAEANTSRGTNYMNEAVGRLVVVAGSKTETVHIETKNLRLLIASLTRLADELDMVNAARHAHYDKRDAWKIENEAWQKQREKDLKTLTAKGNITKDMIDDDEKLNDIPF